jgi:hypothetical protein
MLTLLVDDILDHPGSLFGYLMFGILDHILCLDGLDLDGVHCSASNILVWLVLLVVLQFLEFCFLEIHLRDLVIGHFHHLAIGCCLLRLELSLLFLFGMLNRFLFLLELRRPFGGCSFVLYPEGWKDRWES